MSYTLIKVVTSAEFRKLVYDTLVSEYQNCTKEDVLEMVLGLGFPKFDIDNLGDFIKALPGFIMFEPVLVSTHMSGIFWFVSGDRAITCCLPQKKQNLLNETQEEKPSGT